VTESDEDQSSEEKRLRREQAKVKNEKEKTKEAARKDLTDPRHERSSSPPRVKSSRLVPVLESLTSPMIKDMKEKMLCAIG